jgi:hypothetical protein
MALTGVLWTVPQKQHLWVLLSVLAISVSVWGWLGPALLPQQLHAYGFRTTILYLMVLGSGLPLAVALAGFLPRGSFDASPPE